MISRAAMRIFRRGLLHFEAHPQHFFQSVWGSEPSEKFMRIFIHIRGCCVSLSTGSVELEQSSALVSKNECSWQQITVRDQMGLGRMRKLILHHHSLNFACSALFLAFSQIRRSESVTGEWFLVCVSTSFNLCLTLPVRHAYSTSSFGSLSPLKQTPWKICNLSIFFKLWRFLGWICLKLDSMTPMPLTAIPILSRGHACLTGLRSKKSEKSAQHWRQIIGAAANAAPNWFFKKILKHTKR